MQIREEDEEIEAEGANYQLEMMRCLREVNVDNNTVGWSVSFNNFFSLSESFPFPIVLLEVLIFFVILIS
jgi:outer membrane biogenesis lipoprotein LolB